jgi:hypothetical protein
MTSPVHFALAEFSRITGKRYPALWKVLEALEGEAAQDLARLARDVAYEVTSARKQGARMPWRG